MPQVKLQNTKKTARRYFPCLFMRKQKVDKWITLSDLVTFPKGLRQHLHLPHRLR
ncbi:MAG: hypothetical protein JWM07_282 [Candidatus Saccharibacteria bacterium]|nr:hypothetical protein [Candidatus Saccharibacteria bacterium]